MNKCPECNSDINAGDSQTLVSSKILNNHIGYFAENEYQGKKKYYYASLENDVIYELEFYDSSKSENICSPSFDYVISSLRFD